MKVTYIMTEEQKLKHIASIKAAGYDTIAHLLNDNPIPISDIQKIILVTNSIITTARALLNVPKGEQYV